MANPIYDALNRFIKAYFPQHSPGGANTLHGLPLGITASGEVGLKVINIGNGDVSIDDLPTGDPHQKGKLYKDASGSPHVSQG